MPGTAAAPLGERRRSAGRSAAPAPGGGWTATRLGLAVQRARDALGGGGARRWGRRGALLAGVVLGDWRGVAGLASHAAQARTLESHAAHTRRRRRSLIGGAALDLAFLDGDDAGPSGDAGAGAGDAASSEDEGADASGVDLLSACAEVDAALESAEARFALDEWSLAGGLGRAEYGALAAALAGALWCGAAGSLCDPAHEPGWDATVERDWKRDSAGTGGVTCARAERGLVWLAWLAAVGERKGGDPSAVAEALGRVRELSPGRSVAARGPVATPSSAATNVRASLDPTAASARSVFEVAAACAAACAAQLQEQQQQQQQQRRREQQQEHHDPPQQEQQRQQQQQQQQQQHHQHHQHQRAGGEQQRGRFAREKDEESEASLFIEEEAKRLAAADAAAADEPRQRLAAALAADRAEAAARTAAAAAAEDVFGAPGHKSAASGFYVPDLRALLYETRASLETAEPREPREPFDVAALLPRRTAERTHESVEELTTAKLGSPRRPLDPGAVGREFKWKPRAPAPDLVRIDATLGRALGAGLSLATALRAVELSKPLKRAGSWDILQNARDQDVVEELLCSVAATSAPPMRPAAASSPSSPPQRLQQQEREQDREQHQHQHQHQYQQQQQQEEDEGKHTWVASASLRGRLPIGGPALAQLPAWERRDVEDAVIELLVEGELSAREAEQLAVEQLGGPLAARRLLAAFAERVDHDLHDLCRAEELCCSGRHPGVAREYAQWACRRLRAESVQLVMLAPSCRYASEAAALAAVQQRPRTSGEVQLLAQLGAARGGAFSIEFAHKQHASWAALLPGTRNAVLVNVVGRGGAHGGVLVVRNRAADGARKSRHPLVLRSLEFCRASVDEAARVAHALHLLPAPDGAVEAVAAAETAAAPNQPAEAAREHRATQTDIGLATLVDLECRHRASEFPQSLPPAQAASLGALTREVQRSCCEFFGAARCSLLLPHSWPLASGTEVAANAAVTLIVHRSAAVGDVGLVLAASTGTQPALGAGAGAGGASGAGSAASSAAAGAAALPLRYASASSSVLADNLSLEGLESPRSRGSRSGSSRNEPAAPPWLDSMRLGGSPKRRSYDASARDSSSAARAGAAGASGAGEQAAEPVDHGNELLNAIAESQGGAQEWARLECPGSNVGLVHAATSPGGGVGSWSLSEASPLARCLREREAVAGFGHGTFELCIPLLEEAEEAAALPVALAPKLPSELKLQVAAAPTPQKPHQPAHRATRSRVVLGVLRIERDDPRLPQEDRGAESPPQPFTEFDAELGGHVAPIVVAQLRQYLDHTHVQRRLIREVAQLKATLQTGSRRCLLEARAADAAAAILMSDTVSQLLRSTAAHCRNLFWGPEFYPPGLNKLPREAELFERDCAGLELAESGTMPGSRPPSTWDTAGPVGAPARLAIKDTAIDLYQNSRARRASDAPVLALDWQVCLAFPGDAAAWLISSQSRRPKEGQAVRQPVRRASAAECGSGFRKGRVFLSPTEPDSFVEQSVVVPDVDSAAQEQQQQQQQPMAPQPETAGSRFVVEGHAAARCATARAASELGQACCSLIDPDKRKRALFLPLEAGKGPGMRATISVLEEAEAEELLATVGRRAARVAEFAVPVFADTASEERSSSSTRELVAVLVLRQGLPADGPYTFRGPIESTRAGELLREESLSGGVNELAWLERLCGPLVVAVRQVRALAAQQRAVRAALSRHGELLQLLTAATKSALRRYLHSVSMHERARVLDQQADLASDWMTVAGAGNIPLGLLAVSDLQRLTGNKWMPGKMVQPCEVPAPITRPPPGSRRSGPGDAGGGAGASAGRGAGGDTAAPSPRERLAFLKQRTSTRRRSSLQEDPSQRARMAALKSSRDLLTEMTRLDGMASVDPAKVDDLKAGRTVVPIAGAALEHACVIMGGASCSVHLAIEPSGQRPVHSAPSAEAAPALAAATAVAASGAGPTFWAADGEAPQDEWTASPEQRERARQEQEQRRARAETDRAEAAARDAFVLAYASGTADERQWFASSATPDKGVQLSGPLMQSTGARRGSQARGPQGKGDATAALIFPLDALEALRTRRSALRATLLPVPAQELPAATASASPQGKALQEQGSPAAAAGSRVAGRAASTVGHEEETADSREDDDGESSGDDTRKERRAASTQTGGLASPLTGNRGVGVVGANSSSSTSSTFATSRTTATEAKSPKSPGEGASADASALAAGSRAAPASVLVVPLSSPIDGRALGVVQFVSQPGRSFSEGDEAVAHAFAGWAARDVQTWLAYRRASRAVYELNIFNFTGVLLTGVNTQVVEPGALYKVLAKLGDSALRTVRCQKAVQMYPVPREAGQEQFGHLVVEGALAEALHGLPAVDQQDVLDSSQKLRLDIESDSDHMLARCFKSCNGEVLVASGAGVNARHDELYSPFRTESACYVPVLAATGGDEAVHIHDDLDGADHDTNDEKAARPAAGGVQVVAVLAFFNRLRDPLPFEHNFDAQESDAARPARAPAGAASAPQLYEFSDADVAVFKLYASVASYLMRAMTAAQQS